MDFLGNKNSWQGKQEVLFFPWVVLGHKGRKAGESPGEMEQAKLIDLGVTRGPPHHIMHLPLWLSRSCPSGTRDRICWNQVALFKENGFQLWSPQAGMRGNGCDMGSSGRGKGTGWSRRGGDGTRRGRHPSWGRLSDPNTGMVRQVKCHAQACLPQKEEVIPKVRLCPTKLPESQQEQGTPTPQAAQGGPRRNLLMGGRAESAALQ